MHEEYVYVEITVYRCQYINKNINWTKLRPKYGYSIMVL